MQPHYEKSSGYLNIEWYEKRENSSPVHHQYSQKPTRVQLHPKDEKQVIRATFADKMPTWLEKYAKEHNYKCQQVTRNGEVGFWIAYWRTYPHCNKPYSSPSLDGAFEQFTRQIPEVCDDLGQLVLSNREVIKNNLRNYPTAYDNFGLYFRPEEIEGESGAIVFEDFIPDQEDDEEDEDYRARIERDGELERLIHELITPLPEPVIEEEEEVEEDEISFDEEESELDFDFEEEEESIGEIEFDEEVEEELSLEGLELVDDEEEPIEDINVFESDSDKDIVEDEKVGESEEEIELTEVNSGEEEPIEVVDPQEEKDGDTGGDQVEKPTEESTDEPQEEEETEKLQSDVELKVTEEASKKVVEGQFSLF